MGIYDRDYYRREGPGFFSVFSNGGVVRSLLLINIAVFVFQLLLPQITRYFWLDAQDIIRGEVWRLLTYAFLHDPSYLLHIVFNMLFLWWFGREMEDRYGSKEFLAFYLVSALIGGLAYFGWQLAKGDNSPALGASGAITAVLVLFAFHNPQRVIYIWFVLPIPIWLLVVLQVALDSFVFLGNFRTETAVTCHLGGALFGFLYYKRQWRLLDLWSSFRDLRPRRARPRLRIYREESDTQPVPVSAPPDRADIDEQLEAKLDVVLEKVARTGQNSLTEGERDILLRASEVYKKRRT